jgi:outer membrane immunogenic protein
MPKLFHPITSLSVLRGITSLSVLLVAAVGANAADMRMPVKAPPPAPPPPFSWTGFYIGGNVGAAWANTSVSDSFFGLDFSRTSDAVFIGGGQVGGNYEFSNNVVIGVEGDFDWAANRNNNATVVSPFPPFDTFSASVNDRWLATVAGRLGYAWDRWMIYAKGGGGWVGSSGFTVTDLTTGVSVSGCSSTRSGWLVGGGFEYAFANNWTIRAEYDFLGLSSRSLTVPVGVPIIGGDTFTTGRNNIQMATVGINFLFGGTRY